jgi:hypothetical protein
VGKKAEGFLYGSKSDAASFGGSDVWGPNCCSLKSGISFSICTASLGG